MVPTTAFYNISTPKPSWRKTATSLKSQPRQVHHHNCVNTTQKHPNSWPDVFTEPPNKQQLCCQCQPCSGWAASKPRALLPWLLLHQHQGPCQHSDRGTAPSTPLCPGTEPRVPGPWSAQSYRTIAAPPICPQEHFRKQNFGCRRPGEVLCEKVWILHSPWAVCGKNLLCEQTPILQ